MPVESMGRHSLPISFRFDCNDSIELLDALPLVVAPDITNFEIKMQTHSYLAIKFF